MLRVVLPEEIRPLVTFVDVLKEENPNVQLLENFEEAFVGMQRMFDQEPVAAYDYWVCIEIIAECHNTCHMGAVEIFQEMLDELPQENRPIFIEFQEEAC